MAIGLLMLAAGVGAGLFGSLLGLGGGILIVPILTLGFGLPVREAIGVSLVCVIVTSSAAAGVYLERRVANLRLGMTLELFTAAGAIVGGAIAFLLDERLLAGLFAVVLAYVAVTMLRSRAADEAAPAAPATLGVGAPADVPRSVPPPTPGEQTGSWDGNRRTRRFGLAAVLSVVAGVVSALLGIGGGLIKVPIMHLLLRVPLRAATATSNLMIGITASTSAIVYLLRGGIDAYAVGPTAIGVFLGASVGSRLGHRLDLRILRDLFVAVLLYTALQMALRAAGTS